MLILSNPSVLLSLLYYVLNVNRNTQLGGYGIGYLNALMLWAPSAVPIIKYFIPIAIVWQLTIHAMKRDGNMSDHGSLSLLRQWRIVQSARGPEVQGSQDQSGNIQSLQVFSSFTVHFNLFSLEFQMLQCRFATAYQPLQDMRAERNRKVASNRLFFKLWMIERAG